MDDRYTSELLWRSIDKIADAHEISLPKLALSSKLDQSTFSHARRKRNWMSLQTLTKVLNAYNISIVSWAELVEHERVLLETVERRIKQEKKRKH